MKRYFPFALFGVAVLFTDQFLFYFGNTLVKNGYWRDDIYGEIRLKQEPQVYLLGDCRALVLDPKQLSEELGLPVKNLGVSASGLGHIVLASNVALSSPTPSSKTLILFLNDDILSNSLEKLQSELKQFSLWRPHLSEERKKWIEEQNTHDIKSPPLLKYSGLWVYQGRGPEIFKATVRWFKQLPLSAYSQVDDPNAFFGNHSLVGKEQEYHPREIAGDFNTSLYWLDLTLKELNKAQVPTLIVLSPSHRLQAEEHVKERVIEEVTKLAQRNAIPLLSYLHPELEWATRTEWWGDPRHLNHEGARKFVSALSKDLKRILP